MLMDFALALALAPALALALGLKQCLGFRALGSRIP